MLKQFLSDFVLRALFYTEKKARKLVKAYYQRKVIFFVKQIGRSLAINGPVEIIFPDGLVIGNNVHIGRGAFIDGRGGVIIGDHVHISRNVTIYSTNHNHEGKFIPYDETLIPKRVVIEEGVWIGMNVCVTPGVTIGRGAIIGLGSVVSRDVAPGEIIVSNEQRVVGNRDLSAFDWKHERLLVGGSNGYLAKELTLTNEKIFATRFVFVVSTGRAGSNAIAKFASQYSNISSCHESLYHFLKVLSFNYLCGSVTRDDAKTELYRLFRMLPNIDKDKIYFESDQKLVPFIDILNELFPNARFIAIIRDPGSFTQSAASRSWFKDDYPLTFNSKVTLQMQYISHGCRITADLLHHCTQDEWIKMSQNQRILWYWKFWNSMILNSFENIDLKRRITLKLEDLKEIESVLPTFLGLEKSPVAQIHKTNLVKRKHSSAYKEFAFAERDLNDLKSCQDFYQEICRAVHVSS